MSCLDIVAGSLVFSAAGRDKGKEFLVLSVEENICFVADGKLRKAENPKKKKLKHLMGTNKISAPLNEILQRGDSPTNSEVRKFIKLLNEEA